MDDGIPEHGDAHANSSHEASVEPIFKRSEDLFKKSVKTHFPKDRNCDICQRTKITRAPICSRGAGLSHSMDPSISVQNKNFTGNSKKLAKSSWSPIGSLKSFTLTIPWNSANPVKIFPGIIVRQHHTDQKQMGLLKEQCAE